MSLLLDHRKLISLNKLQCKHIICQGCLGALWDEAIHEGKGNLRCPECEKILTRGLSLVNGTEDDLESVTSVSTAADGTPGPVGINNSPTVKSEATQAPNGKRNRRPGDDYNGLQPTTKASASKWLEAWDKNPKEPIMPSAKTSATINTVLEWQDSAPDDKIIIFVEWNLTARILGRMLEAKGIQFLYYWGEKMTTKSRCKALETFEKTPSIKVLISSVSCGCTSLNITCANRVISMTPWWNGTREEQAFGRVYRHGQTKTTYFRRTVVVGSIDERILELQKRKEGEIAKALAEGRKAKPSLTMEERLYFFNYDFQKHD